MADLSPQKPAGIIARYAARLRFPYLFLLTAALFLVDTFLLDPMPFVDEILLALVTALFGTWRARRKRLVVTPVEDAIDVMSDAPKIRPSGPSTN